jgi:F0F1-type ATP synthase assembly protein I
MLLHTAAGDQSRVQLGDDFGQGQGNQHAIAVVARSENVRRCHTQFAERDFNRPARELREDFFQGDRDARIADVGVLDARLEFERKVAQDGLKRQFDALAGLVKAIAIGIGSGRLRDHGLAVRGWLLVVISLGLGRGFVFGRVLRSFPQQSFNESKHVNPHRLIFAFVVSSLAQIGD